MATISANVADEQELHAMATLTSLSTAVLVWRRFTSEQSSSTASYYVGECVCT